MRLLQELFEQGHEEGAQYWLMPLELHPRMHKAQDLLAISLKGGFFLPYRLSLLVQACFTRRAEMLRAIVASKSQAEESGSEKQENTILSALAAVPDTMDCLI